MELTFIGVAQLLIGLAIVLAGGLRSAFAFLIAMGLLGGSAALNLPALGGSSIQPAQFALLFVYLRILTPRGGFLGLLPDSIRANLWLVLFTLYGIAAALILPRLFAGAIDVYPMRAPNYATIFYREPLAPSPQNITAMVFLAGSLMIALSAWCTCRIQGGVNTLISTVIWVGWAHIALGIFAAVAANTPADMILEELRNANYSQLNQETSGFVRISGLFPETSAFASFGFAIFVLCAELWLRSIRPKATGTLVLAMFAILFMSTSSTAYISLFVYALTIVLRIILLPGSIRKIPTLLLLVGSSVFALAVLSVVYPEFSHSIYQMVLDMTVRKSDSDSGNQRLFWTLQGLEALWVSGGLGIGPGSYRSSSMLVSIVGTMGVFGAFTFLMYLAKVLQPGRESTWQITDSPEATVGGALAVAAVVSLVPAAIGASSPHPDMLFCIFAGAALALRPQLVRVRPATRPDWSREAPTVYVPDRPSERLDNRL